MTGHRQARIYGRMRDIPLGYPDLEGRSLQRRSPGMPDKGLAEGKQEKAKSNGFLGKSKKPKDEHASLRVMYSYVQPHWVALLIGGLLTLLASATSLALPLGVR